MENVDCQLNSFVLQQQSGRQQNKCDDPKAQEQIVIPVPNNPIMNLVILIVVEVSQPVALEYTHY